MEKINEVFVFTARRIVTRRVFEQTYLGRDLILRVEDLGIVVFDRGKSKVMKGTVSIALSRDSFTNETIMQTEAQMKKYQKDLDFENEAVRINNETIRKAENDNNFRHGNIERLKRLIFELKESLTNEILKNSRSD
jgi:hypothetical protein